MEREVLGMTFGYSVVKTFRSEFLRTLVRRDLLGIKLVISDGHEGLKARSPGAERDMAEVPSIHHAQSTCSCGAE